MMKTKTIDTSCWSRHGKRFNSRLVKANKEISKTRPLSSKTKTHTRAKTKNLIKRMTLPFHQLSTSRPSSNIKRFNVTIKRNNLLQQTIQKINRFKLKRLTRKKFHLSLVRNKMRIMIKMIKIMILKMMIRMSDLKRTKSKMMSIFTSRQSRFLTIPST